MISSPRCDRRAAFPPGSSWWPAERAGAERPGARDRNPGKVFRDGVEGLDLGGSSAQSVILMLIVIALTVLQFRYVERRVQYQ